MVIINEDECNDTYGHVSMHEALLIKYPDENIPSERTVYHVMERLGVSHTPRRKPNGITKADRGEAHKSDDLLKRDFNVEKPCEKCVTDITDRPTAFKGLKRKITLTSHFLSILVPNYVAKKFLPWSCSR